MFHGLMLLMISMAKKLLEHFMKKELQKKKKKNQQGFEIEKMIKKKGNKPYVKWEGYDNSCISWIDEKDIL